MAAGNKQIPPEDTLASLLLTLTALSGEFPTAQISRLPSTGAYQEKILKSLKGEKLLRTYYRDGLRALRSTTAAKKLLVDKWPDRFLPYLSGSTETWEYKAEMRLKAMLQTELCQCRLPGQYQNAALNAIVFGQDMERMLPLMNDGGGQRDYFVLDGNYQHFYYLTSDPVFYHRPNSASISRNTSSAGRVRPAAQSS